MRGRRTDPADLHHTLPMRALLQQLRPYLIRCGLLSLGLNLLLLAPTLYTLVVFDRVLTSFSEETLVVLTVGAIGALVLAFLLDLLRSRIFALAGISLERQLAPQVIAGLLNRAVRLSPADFQQGMRDVGSVRSFLAGQGIQALFDAPWLPFYLVLMFLFHPLLGGLAVASVLLLLALTIIADRATTSRIEAALSESRTSNAFLDAALRNAEVVNALGMRRGLTTSWQQRAAPGLDTQKEVALLRARVLAIGRLVRQALQLLTLGAGAWLVIHDNLAPGIMVAATIILGRALQPLEGILSGWRSLIEVRGAYRRLVQLDDLQQPDRTALPAPSGELRCENLVFSHAPGLKPAVRGVSLQLAAGEALAIIGPSGAGKSTLARLIVGHWKPQSGTVRLDGADTAQWQRDALGVHLGYVPQDVELFPCTVAENIARLGPVDSAAVVAAGQRARAHEVILGLAQGYDTPLGDGGAQVSAGQRQRIALARAVYGAPRLIVMDEPNSNLDTDGEEALVQAMRALKADGVTQVIVTHRPSLLAAVDKVLVMRDGAVELFGPRDQVLGKVVRPALATPGPATPPPAASAAA